MKAQRNTAKPFHVLPKNRQHYQITLGDAINAHQEALTFGPNKGVGILNLTLIQSAIGRPYTGYYRFIHQKAAALVQSLQDLVGFLGELHGVGVDLFLHQQGINTTTPAGKAMFQMMGVFAEFERSMIQERVMAGLARAKASGKRLGRPRISDDRRDTVVAAKDEGLSVRRIADQVGDRQSAGA